MRRQLLVHLWVQVGLWVALAVVVNHLAAAWFGRIDLTADQRFSLSAVARQTVAALDKPALATVWFTEDLDPPYHNHRDALSDLLVELQARSGGRLEVRWRDPTGDEGAIAEAQAAGVQPITYTFRRWDRQEARQVWMGVSLTYGERQEVADGLVSVGRMEYDLVRALRAVVTPPDERPLVAWLQGDGEPELGGFAPTHPLGALREQLRKTYRLRTIAPGAEGIPEDVDAVLVVGPQRAVPERVQLHLDQFLIRGGTLAWFTSQFQPDYDADGVREVRHGLHALLGHHGVQLGRDLVLDRASNERMTVPVVVGQRRVLTPLSHPLAVATTAVDRTFGPVRDVRRVVLPLVSSLTPSEGVVASVDTEVWVRSADTAVRVRDLPTLDPAGLQDPIGGEEAGPFPLVVGVSGRFRSFWADRPLPPDVDAADVEVDGRPARMVVGGSADMVANNPALVLNALDWLLADSALVDVRTRGGATPVLDAPPPEVARQLKAVIVGVPLVLLVLLGLLARRRR